MAVARAALSREAADAQAVIVWREGGTNTFDIAKAVGLTEPDVCRAIAADQDARHRARVAEKAVRR